METGLILLAAGESRRMARPKLLLPWGEASVIAHQIAVWEKLGAEQIAVVCAAGDDAMRAELDRLQFSPANCIINVAPQRGMFSSICCAAQWTDWNSGLTHWVISLGDQPHLRLETFQTLLAFAETRSEKICQPRLLGHLRHPVVLPKTFFLELRTTKARTLKDYLKLRAANIAGCDLDDPGLDLDIDTPADYEKVKSSTHPAPSASNADERSRR